MMTVIAIGIALFFAMNIGGSGAAASLGIAYGTGAVKIKRHALIISSIGIFIGAAVGSKAVISTIGSGIIASNLLTNEIVIILILSAAFTLFIANVTGIPLSTSEVTVGSIIGIGIAYRSIYITEVSYIVMWWILAPILATIFVWIFRFIIIQVKKIRLLRNKVSSSVIILFITVAGFLEAVAAGMNNVANAVGPLVGGNLLAMQDAMLLGGVFIALGALLFGGRVLETNGKKITALSLTDGFIVSSTSAIIAIIASLFGIPIPMTQITTAGIIGVGIANDGFGVLRTSIIKRILIVWVASPVISSTIAYALIMIFIENNHLQTTIFTAIFLLILMIYCLGLYIYRKKKSKQRSVVK